MTLYPPDFPSLRFSLRAKLPVFKKRLARAEDCIKKFQDMGGRWYVACSGGKDSVVLAHLVNTIAPGTLVWSEKDDMDYPGEREYLAGISAKYGWSLEIASPSVSLWDVIGTFDTCEDLHSRGTSFSDQFFYSLVAEQESKYDGAYLGLRTQESRGRFINYAVRSDIYQRKNGKHTCTPLATWEAEDVFAYLVSREIPIFDVYFKTLFVGGDPCKIRKSWILPSGRAAQGQALFLKHYYPEIFDRLRKICPEVNSYA